MDAGSKRALVADHLMKRSGRSEGVRQSDERQVAGTPEELSGVAAVGAARRTGWFAWFRTLSFVPGGLGTFEGAPAFMLRSHGILVSAALSATLIFRALSFWLPMVPGMICARRLTSSSSS